MSIFNNAMFNDGYLDIFRMDLLPLKTYQVDPNLVELMQHNFKITHLTCSPELQELNRKIW